MSTFPLTTFQTSPSNEPEIYSVPVESVATPPTSPTAVPLAGMLLGPPPAKVWILQDCCPWASVGIVVQVRRKKAVSEKTKITRREIMTDPHSGELAGIWGPERGPTGGLNYQGEA